MAKDLFSAQAKLYARYRPGYPEELFAYIASFVKEKRVAWDCATGNGQAAVALSGLFERVEATDLSPQQLEQAVQMENVHYRVAKAEETPFADNLFDLVTVATAYHWLDAPAFEREAKRVCKNESVIAIWTYYTLHLHDEKLDQLYQHFYHDIVGPYWDPERKFVDDQYRTVLFPFEPLPVKPFETVMHWDRETFKGYLLTWSATRHYEEKINRSPLEIITPALEELWNDTEIKKVTFPIALRMGSIRK